MNLGKTSAVDNNFIKQCPAVIIFDNTETHWFIVMLSILTSPNLLFYVTCGNIFKSAISRIFDVLQHLLKSSKNVA